MRTTWMAMIGVALVLSGCAPPNGQVLTFTDANFANEVLKSPQPVLVDFWAEWCGPCKQLSPIVEGLAGEYAGRVKVGKVNVEENPTIAAKYNINAIPVLLIFQDGKVVSRMVGLKSKDYIAGKLSALVQ